MKTAGEQKIADQIRPSVEAMGYSLWGIEWQNQGKFSLLRIYVDKTDGISLDECALLSEQIGTVLDVEGALESSYRLEVSSPGLERTLFTPEQYRPYHGQTIRVRLNQPVSERRQYEGTLTSQSETAIVLTTKESLSITIAFDNIAKATLVYEFQKQDKR